MIITQRNTIGDVDTETSVEIENGTVEDCAIIISALNEQTVSGQVEPPIETILPARAYVAYASHEYCNDINCACLLRGDCDGSPCAAKDFHTWLTENGYTIEKEV